MLKIADSGDTSTIEVDDDGLLLILGSVREAIQELGEDEFELRIGIPLKEARPVLEQLITAYRRRRGRL